MSINSALLAGTSGLTAQSSAMAAISDNIANVNTVGYKRTESLFSPVVNADTSIRKYNAGGVVPSNRQLIAQQGLLQSSSSSTDLAVSGDGFFVVSETPTAPSTSESFLFTRAGAFSKDEDGYLRNSGGHYLQGWPVAADGSVNANPSDLTQLETINIAAIGGTADPTRNVRINANLQATTPVSAAEATYDPADTNNNMASGSVTPDFQTPVQVYDTQGGVRTLSLKMLKSDTPNEWHAEIHADPASDVTTGAGLVDGQIATGIIAFDQNSRIDLANSTLPLTLEFLASDNGGALGAQEVQWAATEGVGAQTITFDLGTGSAAGGMTQFSSETVVDSTAVDGAVFGDLADIEVDESGYVIASFTNGVIKSIYQVPLATFINPNGLEPESGGAFRVSPRSGGFNIKQPGLGGAGIISDQRLESSNVDLATEFTNLITTQRAYSASSKIITTADEMLSELIALKR